MIRRILSKLRPVDLVTAVLIVAWATLKCLSINHITDYIILSVVAFYYGQTKRKEPA